MDIKNVTVLGAGIMGRGIAYASLVGGYTTYLVDVHDDILDSARNDIARFIEQGIRRGKIHQETRTRFESHFFTSTDFEGMVKDADFVIEAVPEKIALKLELLRKAESLTQNSTRIVSNTSSLSITELASVLDRPENFAGMHFFNPVPRMKLVEIVRGLETSDETISAVEEVARRMGKETVVIKDSPGFITSRMNALIGNEAFFMLQEGLASAEDIDKALKLGLNHPMGPFELVDLVGLDTRLAVLKYLHKMLGEKYRPAPLLIQYVKAGRLGKKTGRGVYVYPENEEKTHR